VPVSEAFSPAGISSFFEVCTTDATGNPIADPAMIGARGGGFAIKRGVKARVSTRSSSDTQVKIKINSEPAPEANTTRSAVQELLRRSNIALTVHIDLDVAVPIGAGYGTSAAGTAASCLALADAADLPVTFNELGRITHIAEVINRTGLGTASALFEGGFVLVTEPGAPGIGEVDRLRFPEDHSIICAYLEPMLTREALAKTDIASRVNASAQRAMAAIRNRPDLSTFLAETRRFTDEVGFQDSDVARLIEIMLSAGASGAAQNMIGKAVHAVARNAKAKSIIKKVRSAFPSALVFLTGLDEQGVRLVKKPKPKH